MIKTVLLSDIQTKDTLQPRVTVNFVIVSEYAEAMKDGQIFPPLDVVWDGEIYWLWDGYHRKEAIKQIGLSEIDVKVVEGTFQDAEWLALGANTKHGFHRSNEDKRRAVQLALKHPKAGKLSDKRLAEHCGVSVPFVGNIRAIIKPFNDRRQVTRNGTTYTQDTTNIGKKKKSTKPSPTVNLSPQATAQLPFTDLDQNQAEINKLANLPEETQSEVVSMIAGGEAKSVKAAKKKIETAKQIEAIAETEYPAGKYHVIVIDPPWRYENRAKDATHRAANPYPDMTIDEIKNWEQDNGSVSGLALNDCILWLWTTNAHMKQAYEIAEYWGFEVKTILTWIKDKMGTGDWLRGKSEHCLMCIKGKPVVNLTNQTTILNGPLREHSRKPDEFYQMVDELCPGLKIDIFSREQREGWETYGNERQKFAETF